jgi:hypothetical protein
MKALKIIISIIIIVVLLFGIYMIFFSHPIEVKRIIDDYEKQKTIFESKITAYETDMAKIEKKIKKQELKVIDAEDKYSQAEADRLQWKEKYEKLKVIPIKTVDEIENLDEAKAEIKVLTFRLGECNAGIKKTEDSLFACHKLNLELEVQKSNWIEKYAKLKLKSEEQTKELAKRDITIRALEKVSLRINLKKVAIYTGVGLIVIKLFQIILK